MATTLSFNGKSPTTIVNDFYRATLMNGVLASSSYLRQWLQAISSEVDRMLLET